MRKIDYTYILCNSFRLLREKTHGKGAALLGLLVLLSGLTACSHDDEPDSNCKQGDVVVYVDLVATRSGDPGAAHLEDQMQWDNLHIYLLYEDGRVAEHVLSRNEYEGLEQKEFTLRVPVGKAKVYAVAHTDNVQLADCSAISDVHNLSTGDISGLRAVDLVNLFSGRNETPIDITPESKGKTSVTLKRIVAKIDVQYDVQEGLDGKYSQITMNGIEFSGPKQGFFFADKVTAGPADIGVITSSVCKDAVSQRNGREYFYTFADPDNRHQFNFNLHYTPKNGAADALNGGYTYTFKFNQAPEAAQWYKVNLTVSGTRAVDANNVITLNPRTN